MRLVQRIHAWLRRLDRAWKLRVEEIRKAEDRDGWWR